MRMDIEIVKFKIRLFQDIFPWQHIVYIKLLVTSPLGLNVTILKI